MQHRVRSEEMEMYESNDDVALTQFNSQIREQILVPDLYVLTVELVAYKKKTKTGKNINSEIFNFILCNFSVRTLQYF